MPGNVACDAEALCCACRSGKSCEECGGQAGSRHRGGGCCSRGGTDVGPTSISGHDGRYPPGCEKWQQERTSTALHSVTSSALTGSEILPFPRPEPNDLPDRPSGFCWARS